MSGTTLDAFNNWLSAAAYLTAAVALALLLCAVGVGMLTMARAESEIQRAETRRWVAGYMCAVLLVLMIRLSLGWFGFRAPEWSSTVIWTTGGGILLGLVVFAVGMGALATRSLGDAVTAVVDRAHRERSR